MSQQKMDFFLKRKNPESSEHGSNNKASKFVGQRPSVHEYVDINDLPYDPTMRKKFSDFGDRMTLEHQLPLYIDNIREDGRFSNLTDIGTLAKIMVDTKKHLAYPLIFRLLKLVLTLPVAIATVERCFSAMKIVKTNLRNRIADSFMSD
ncbi:unnamed protein product [Rhodiola kirilowii]